MNRHSISLNGKWESAGSSRIIFGLDSRLTGLSGGSYRRTVRASHQVRSGDTNFPFSAASGAVGQVAVREPAAERFERSAPVPAVPVAASSSGAQAAEQVLVRALAPERPPAGEVLAREAAEAREHSALRAASDMEIPGRSYRL